MVEYIQQALKQAAYEATVLLYSPGIDPFLEDLAKDADRVFYFREIRPSEYEPKFDNHCYASGHISGEDITWIIEPKIK